VLVWDSYVEWREEQDKKIPYESTTVNEGPIYLAGLWASWGKDETYLESSTLLLANRTLWHPNSTRGCL